MIYVILIAMLSTSWMMPWWGLGVWTFLGGLMMKSALRALLILPLAGGLMWLLWALALDQEASGLISERMGGVFSLSSSLHLFLATLGLGFFLGLGGALMGWSLRRIVWEDRRSSRPKPAFAHLSSLLALGLTATLLTSAQRAQAAAFETNLFYISDNLEAGDKATGTKMFVDGAILINLTKSGKTLIGWSFGMISTSDTGADERTFSLMEMGPKLSYLMGRERHWSLAFTYNLQSTAKYTSAGGEAEWRGVSYKVELGYTPQITERIWAGLKLNYYLASFGEQLVGSTTYSTISNSRSLIYPSVSFSFRWD